MACTRGSISGHDTYHTINSNYICAVRSMDGANAGQFQQTQTNGVTGEQICVGRLDDSEIVR